MSESINGLIEQLRACSDEELTRPDGEWMSGAYPTIYDLAATALAAQEARIAELTRANAECANVIAGQMDQLAVAAKALGEADAAIAEMFRYYDGGETRGSYDGKPERAQLRKAGYATRQALATIRPSDTAGGEGETDPRQDERLVIATWLRNMGNWAASGVVCFALADKIEQGDYHDIRDPR